MFQCTITLPMNNQYMGNFSKDRTGYNLESSVKYLMKVTQ